MAKALNRQQAIGIFDSGIGGLTVARAISKLLPEEQIIYFGDTAHMPYGDRNADSIRYYCVRIAKFLLRQNCKMIVIACNTASSVGYKMLVDFFEDTSLFVNVVDPLVAEVSSRNYRNVGVIATKATIESQVYEKKLLDSRPDMEVNALATPLLAPMIESGYFNDGISHAVISEYLSQPDLQHLDALLLACTHYPLIHKEISEFYENRVDVVDSTIVTAQAVKESLEIHDLLNEQRLADDKFYVSELTQSFKETTRLFYGKPITLEHCPIWQNSH